MIVGYVEMALERPGGEAMEADLQAVRQAAQRGALLTRQLLTFAGKQIVIPKVVNLKNDQIEGASGVFGVFKPTQPS